MEYRSKISEHKRSCNPRFLIIALFLSFIIIQASMACGANPQAYSPTVLAASHVNCVNPQPPNSGITAIPMPATPGIVVINEVLSFPQSHWNCTVSSDVSRQDNIWVEIYNPQNQPYDLYAARASIDEGLGSSPYYVRVGSTISAHGFLVVFPFENLPPNAFTQLPTVRLLLNEQIVIDQVSVPALSPDTSYARIPDGSNNWQITTTPTIGSSNQYPTGTVQTENATSTQNHTTKQKPTKTHGGGTANDGTSTDTSTTDIQPTWSTLGLPSSGSNNATPQQDNSSLSPISADPFDLLKKTLLTLFIVILFVALPWGWRLYKKRSATKLR